MMTASPLAETRLAGQRKREEWFEQLAHESHLFQWNEAQITAAVMAAVQTAVAAGNIRKTSALSELIRQGQLVAHPDVRADFDRLRKLRDAVWTVNRPLARAVLHGPSQLLIDILQQQKVAHSRHRVAGADAYIRHLVDRLDSRRRRRSGG